jgi:hypothetical protein
MIRIPLMILITLAMGTTVKSQYYYDDIVNNRQVRAELALLKDKKIKGVKVISLEANGTESEGFVCQKKINRDFTEVELYTQTSERTPIPFFPILIIWIITKNG